MCAYMYNLRAVLIQSSTSGFPRVIPAKSHVGIFGREFDYNDWRAHSSRDPLDPNRLECRFRSVSTYYLKNMILFFQRENSLSLRRERHIKWSLRSITLFNYTHMSVVTKSDSGCCTLVIQLFDQCFYLFLFPDFHFLEPHFFSTTRTTSLINEDKSTQGGGVWRSRWGARKQGDLTRV